MRLKGGTDVSDTSWPPDGYPYTDGVDVIHDHIINAIVNRIAGNIDVTTDLNTIGTPDTDVFLRGDGAWAEPPGLPVLVPDDLITPAGGTPSSSTFLRGDGAWATPAGGGGGGGGFALIHVISNDAPAEIKALASDYVLVCDGTADQSEINTAIQKAAALYSRNSHSGVNGTSLQLAKVQLSGGRFNISSAIQMRSGVWLEGAGWLTELRSVNCNDPGLITLASVHEHGCHVTSLWINLNNSGTCNGVEFDMTDSSNNNPAGVSGYPSTSPDSYHLLRDLYITDGENAGANTDHASGNDGRIGIRMYDYSSGSGHNRGNIIDACQIRRMSGHGISMEGASDCFISNCHIGTIGYDDGANGTTDINASGIFNEGANNRFSNNKAFYIQGPGFWQYEGTSGCTISCLEVQDSIVGVRTWSKLNNWSGITIDCCLVGIDIDHDSNNFTGVMVMKAAQRFAGSMTVGVRINVDCGYNFVTGHSSSTGITAPFTNNGSTSTNYVMLTTGSTVVKVPAAGW